VDKINDQFMKRMEAKQRKADLETVKDAAHVNQLFGGSFSDGVGSNTWAHTPFQKYDYKDRAHMESLKEVEPKEQEAAKCMELAKAFKGARRAGAMKVTMAEKEEARKCAAFVMAQRKGWKARTAKKLAIDTSMPQIARPHEVHIYKPDKALLGRRAKIEKKAKKLEAQREAAEAAAREAAMHPHIIKAHHFFPKRGKKAGHSAKVLEEAKKARKELSMLKHKMPSFVNSQSFDDRQGARSRDAKDVAAKLNFWENMGSEKEKLATSQGRSKTEYVVTDPMAGARKAQKTSSLLLQKTTMLLQVHTSYISSYISCFECVWCWRACWCDCVHAANLESSQPTTPSVRRLENTKKSKNRKEFFRFFSGPQTRYGLWCGGYLKIRSPLSSKRDWCVDSELLLMNKMRARVGVRK